MRSYSGSRDMQRGCGRRGGRNLERAEVAPSDAVHGRRRGEFLGGWDTEATRGRGRRRSRRRGVGRACRPGAVKGPDESHPLRLCLSGPWMDYRVGPVNFVRPTVLVRVRVTDTNSRETCGCFFFWRGASRG